MTNLGAHSELWPTDDGAEPCAGQLVVEDDSGPIWTVVCGACGFTVGLPARKADAGIRRRMLHQQAGFPALFVGKHFEQDPQNRSAVKALHDWLTEYARFLPDRRRWDRLPADEQERVASPKCPRSPALHGTPGIGKSHLLVALCERLIRDCDAAVLFRSSARLLDELQEAFDHPGEHALLWHRALSGDVLALDDLGAERPTEWRADRLARLVDERWERDLPIVLATNFPPRAWDRAFDERTVSRLRGMTFSVELRGPDRRQMAMATESPQGVSDGHH